MSGCGGVATVRRGGGGRRFFKVKCLKCETCKVLFGFLKNEEVWHGRTAGVCVFVCMNVCVCACVCSFVNVGCATAKSKVKNLIELEPSGTESCLEAKCPEPADGKMDV